jgi:hypothetical protein
MIPQVAPLQPAPETFQVTAVFDVPVTEAINCWVVPVIVDAVFGVTTMATAEGVATPVPLTPIATVPFVTELLTIDSWPVIAPAEVGRNCIFKVAAWPGFNVAGSAGPDSVKPAPASVAPLIVTGIVPVEVRVTDCVAMVLIVTSPNA